MNTIAVTLHPSKVAEFIRVSAEKIDEYNRMWMKPKDKEEFDKTHEAVDAANITLKGEITRLDFALITVELKYATGFECHFNNSFEWFHPGIDKKDAVLFERQISELGDYEKYTHIMLEAKNVPAFLRRLTEIDAKLMAKNVSFEEEFGGKDLFLIEFRSRLELDDLETIKHYLMHTEFTNMMVYFKVPGYPDCIVVPSDAEVRRFLAIVPHREQAIAELTEQGVDVEPVPSDPPESDEDETISDVVWRPADAKKKADETKCKAEAQKDVQTEHAETVQLPGGLKKKSFEVNNSVTIRGVALQTIIVVPKGERIIINSPATLEGIVFVGERFYEEHKDNLKTEIYNSCDDTGDYDSPEFASANALAEKYKTEFEEFSKSSDRDALYESADKNVTDALLHINADNVVLRNIVVIGSECNGIRVSGRAEFSNVSASKSKFSNLVIADGAEVSFVPANKESFLENAFSYSRLGYGVLCNGKLLLESGSSLSADGNMLQGLRLNGSLNEGKENVGRISAKENMGNGICIDENAIAHLDGVYVAGNKGTSITLGGKANLTANNIESRENKSGIGLFNHSCLSAETLRVYNNRGEGICLFDNARLKAEKGDVTENSEEGLYMEGDSEAELYTFEVGDNYEGGISIEGNANLWGIYGEVYNNYVSVSGNAKAEFRHSRFFHKGHWEEGSEEIDISVNASVKLEDCYFYDCPYEDFVITVSEDASLECQECYFGFLPEDERNDEHDHIRDINSGILAKGNAKVSLSCTYESYCTSEYFIKAEKTTTISTDTGEVEYV